MSANGIINTLPRSWTIFLCLLLVIPSIVIISGDSTGTDTRGGSGYDPNSVSIPYFVDHRSSFSSRESINPDGAKYVWEMDPIGFPIISGAGDLFFYNLEGQDGTRYSNMVTRINPVDGSIMITMGQETGEWSTPTNDPVLDHLGNPVSTYIDYGWSTSYSGSNHARVTTYDGSTGDVIWNSSHPSTPDSTSLGTADFISPPMIGPTGDIYFQIARGTSSTYIKWSLAKTSASTGSTEILYDYYSSRSIPTAVPRLDDSSNIYLLYNNANSDQSNPVYEGMKLHKFTSGGSEQWSLDWTGTGEFLVDTDSNIYGTFPETVGTTTMYYLKCISSSGTVSWEFPEPVDPYGLSIADDNTIYATIGRTLYAIDNTGSELWSLSFPGSVGAGLLGKPSPNSIDGILVSDLEKVYHLDLDGNLVWIVDIGRTLEEPGKIYIAGNDRFYLIEADNPYRIGAGRAYMLDGDSKGRVNNFLAFDMGDGGDFGPWDWGGGGDSIPRPRLSFDLDTDGKTIGEVMADGTSTIDITVYALDRKGNPLKDIELVFSEPVGGYIDPMDVKTGSDGSATVTYTAPSIRDYPALSIEKIEVETGDGKARSSAELKLSDPGPEFTIDDLGVDSMSYDLGSEISVNYSISTRMEKTNVLITLKLVSPDGHVLKTISKTEKVSSDSSYTGREKISLPTAGGGDYHITLEALNENSRDDGQVTIGVGSDLFISSGDVRFSNSVIDGQKVSLDLEIDVNLRSNGGRGVVTQIMIIGSRSGELDLLSADITAGSGKVKKNTSLNIRIGEEIKVILDPENELVEIDEGNNVVTRAFSGPEIEELRSTYSGYFLEGVSLRNRYTALFDDEWKDKVSRVDFLIDDIMVSSDSSPKDGFYVDLDMGTLNASGNNEMKVIATSKEGLSSSPFSHQITIVTSPGWFSSLLDTFKPSWAVNGFEKGLFDNKFEMSFSVFFKKGADINIPIPLVGGKFGGKMGITLSFKFTSEGKISIELPLEVEVEIASKASKVTIAVSTDVQLIKDGHFTWAMQNVKVSGSFEMEFPLGPQLKWNKFGIEVDIGVAIVPSLKLDMELKPVEPQQDPDFGSFSATGTMEVKTAFKPKGETDVKLGKVLIEGEGSGTMKFSFGPFNLTEVEVGASAKAEFETGWLKRTYQYSTSFKYPATRSTDEFFTLETVEPLRRPDTDYPEQVNEIGENKHLLASDIFSNNKPFLLGHDRAFWVHDDRSRDQPLGYEIYSRSISSNSVDRITNDDIPDIDPKAIAHGGSTIVIFRSFMDDDLSSSSDPLEPNTNIALRYCIENGSGWTDPIQVPGLSGYVESFDVATGRGGEIFLSVLTDEDGNISSEGDERIHLIQWNGTEWTNSQILSENLSVIYGPILTTGEGIQYQNPNHGSIHVHWAQDNDGNSSDELNRVIVGSFYREDKWVDVRTYLSGISSQFDITLILFMNNGGTALYYPLFSYVSQGSLYIRSEYKNIDVPLPGRALSSWIWDADGTGISLAVLILDENGEQQMIYNRIPWILPRGDEETGEGPPPLRWVNLGENISSPSMVHGLVSDILYLKKKGEFYDLFYSQINLTQMITFTDAFLVNFDKTSFIYEPGVTNRVICGFEIDYPRDYGYIPLRIAEEGNISGHVGYNNVNMISGTNEVEIPLDPGLGDLSPGTRLFLLTSEVQKLGDLIPGVNGIEVSVSYGYSDIEIVGEPYFDPENDELVLTIINNALNSTDSASVHLLNRYWDWDRSWIMNSHPYESLRYRYEFLMDSMSRFSVESVDVGPISGGELKILRIPLEREDIDSSMMIEIVDRSMITTRNYSIEIPIGVDLEILEPRAIPMFPGLRLETQVRNLGFIECEALIELIHVDENGTRKVIANNIKAVGGMGSEDLIFEIDGIDGGSFILVASPEGVPDLDLSNNQLTRSYYQMIRSDIVIVKAEKKDDVFEVLVKNQGGIKAHFITVEIFDTTGAPFLVDSRVIPVLDPGSSVKFQVPVEVMRTGNISILIDRNDTVDEKNEGNNQMIIEISLQPEGNGGAPPAGGSSGSNAKGIGNLCFWTLGIGLFLLVIAIVVIFLISRKSRKKEKIEKYLGTKEGEGISDIPSDPEVTDIGLSEGLTGLDENRVSSSDTDPEQEE